MERKETLREVEPFDRTSEIASGSWDLERSCSAANLFCLSISVALVFACRNSSGCPCDADSESLSMRTGAGVAAAGSLNYGSGRACGAAPAAGVAAAAIAAKPPIAASTRTSLHGAQTITKCT